MATLESQLDKRVKRLLDAHGAQHWQTTTMTKVYRGIPDRFVLYRGVFIGIELKGDDTPHQPLQLIKREKIREAGGISFYARGEKGYEFIVWLLDKIDEALAPPLQMVHYPTFVEYIDSMITQTEGVGL